jgi:hypothetical protein
MDRHKLARRLAAILLLSGVLWAQTPSTSSVQSANTTKNAIACPDTSVSANTITCVTAVGFTGYVADQAFDVRVANSATAATTININALGAKAVTYNGTTVIIAGVLTAGGTYRMQYDGTRFVVQGVVTPATAQLHSVTVSLDGGGVAIVTGAVGIFPTAAYACTINRVDISADQSGSITIDVWKAAGAIPTSGNKISASAPLTLSSAQLSQNGSLTGWSTSVASGDVFGFTVVTAATVQKVTGQIWCQ